MKRPKKSYLIILVTGAIALLGLWFAWNGAQPALQAQDSEPAQPDEAKAAGEHAHTNKLVDETSPYLLQHAHNPVDWYPWGEEAFEKAKREGKPVFLSVGYSTCYWCHVMEKESFEDEEVAEILNEHYVAIKVDREERPDVDKQFMLATQLMTRRGGWPNSVWLTPEGKPWMAGTYFPKPQFMNALNQMAGAWDNRRDDVLAQAEQLASAIERAGSETAAEDVELTDELIDGAAKQLANRFDSQQGGFGRAPKFPPHGTLGLLVRQYRDTGDESLLTPITETLDAMWLGGMHDHIGGGFHRYSTDREWLLPHFEKMLYDNAQLMRAFTDGLLIAENELYRRAVADIYGWLEREMTSPEGGFYSAIDSGEVDKEGEAYVWPLEEVKEVLGEEDGALFAEIYNLEPEGNFREEATGERPGTNIPHLDKPLTEIAEEREQDPKAFRARIEAMREKLLARRQTWERPHKDDKILTSWNGLMIGALAYAGRQLNEPRYTAAATRAADFILDKMMKDGTLLRTYREGEAKQRGFLDDYAYFGRALVELHRATGDARWLNQAEKLAAAVLDDFQDSENGGFFFTTQSHDDMILRSKGLEGGGNIPNASGVAVQFLLELSRLTGKDRYAEAVKTTLESMAGAMQSSPFSNESLLVAAAGFLRGPHEEPGAAPAAGDEMPAADAKADASSVSISAYASRLRVRPGASLNVAVLIDIEEGWHLYGKNPEADFLIPTTISLESPGALSGGEIVSPEPHTKIDPILKQKVSSYTGRIRFDLPVSINTDTESGEKTLKLNVKTQACDASRCLPPETTTLEIPLEIDPNAPDRTRHPDIFTGPAPTDAKPNP